MFYFVFLLYFYLRTFLLKFTDFISSFLDRSHQWWQHHEWNSLSLGVSISQWLSCSSPSQARLHQLLSYFPVLITYIQGHYSKKCLLTLDPIPIIPILFIVTFLNAKLYSLSHFVYFRLLLYTFFIKYFCYRIDNVV